MELKDVISFVSSELRAEKAVSLNLSNHQFFAWKCGELDKLIGELESVRTAKDLKELLSHIMIFNQNQLVLLKRFPGVKEQAENEFERMSADDMAVINCEYNRVATPGIINLVSEKEDKDVKLFNINGEVLDKFISKVLPYLSSFERKDEAVKPFDLYSGVNESFNSDKLKNYIYGAVDEFDNMMAEIQGNNEKKK